VTALLVSAPACVLCDPAGDPAPPRKTIVFTPDRQDRCDYFFVTEFNASAANKEAQDVVDRILLTDALGVMRNIDRSRALGVSIDAHLIGGAIRFAPTIRFKQWLSHRASLDLTVGYASASIEQEGAVGLIADARYSPSAWFHAQVGVCRVRNVTSIFYVPEKVVNGDTQTVLYAGVGLAGVPGVISWGAQAIGWGAAVLTFSGMD
jgi:hypothetical protein